MKPMSLCLKDISIYKDRRREGDKPLMTLDSLQDWYIFSMFDQDSVRYWFIAGVRQTLLTTEYFCIKICKAETLEWQCDLDIYVDEWKELIMKNFYKEFLTETDNISESQSLDCAVFSYGVIWAEYPLQGS